MTSLSPSSGPTAGGTAVTITGSGFSTAAGATAVSFGASPASSVSCGSVTSCLAVGPAGVAGAVDVRVTVGGHTSPVTSGDRFSYVAAATTQPVAVPALTNGYGYWVTFTSAARGPISAAWTTTASVQGTLAVYAGNPFAGMSDPVRRSPPSGALATTSGRRSSFSVTTTSRPAGVYTVFFYAGGSEAASSGTVTYWK